MFDIGFLEILVILIIALLVVGPERMPELARKIGGFMGKMRRFINSVKEDGQMQDTIKDFKDSMNMDEQRQQINTIQEELQSGLNFEGDVKIEDFQRPFGGETVPDTDAAKQASQFNKAPSQPIAPQTVKPETEASNAPKPAEPAETVISSAPIESSAKAPETAPQADVKKS